MKLYIRNSLNRQLEEFLPLMNDPAYKWEKKDTVSIYSCGPTVYGDAHIWNLRAFWFADVLKCSIKYLLDMPVTHIMNITDVWHLTDDWDHWEDKMEKWSKRDWITARDVSRKYWKRFIDFNAEFHNETPDQYTRATKYIKEQIAIVKKLSDQWLTYEIENDWIYMDTAKLPDYGKMLPPWHIEWLQDGARVEDHWKRSKTDFALWKYSPHDEQRQMEWIFDWDRSAQVIDEKNRDSLTDLELSSRGFPGWHIECSAMSRATLGENMDIHTWWFDHIPVHHTNEIAQSEYSFCKHKPWVKYWMHNQFLNFDWLKLSKSLGNAFTLPEIEAKWFSPLDLRFFFFTAQYSSFQDFNWENLTKAKNTRHNLQKKLNWLVPASPALSWWDLVLKVSTEQWKQLISSVESSIWNNLNTPQLLTAVNIAMNDLNDDIVTILEYIERTIIKCDLFVTVVKDEIPSEIIDLAEQRVQAKKDGNYQLADQLREDIKMAGFEVHDWPNWYSIT